MQPETDSLPSWACVYQQKALMRATWLQESGIWRDLNRSKAVVVEPRGVPEQFNKEIKRFRSLVDKGKGAIFMAVCRGKVCTLSWHATAWHGAA